MISVYDLSMTHYTFSSFPGPNLKTLCKIAVIQYSLEQSGLPHDIRSDEHPIWSQIWHIVVNALCVRLVIVAAAVSSLVMMCIEKLDHDKTIMKSVMLSVCSLERTSILWCDTSILHLLQCASLQRGLTIWLETLKNLHECQNVLVFFKPPFLL